MSIPQVFVGLVAAISAVLALVGAVRLVVVEDKLGPTLMFAVGLLVAFAGLVAFRWLRKAERYELQVSNDGLELLHRDQRQVWSWDEISGISVIGGAIRRLAIEDQRAVQLQARAPRLHDLAQTLGQHSTVGTLVPIDGMEPGEHAILSAIRDCSRGRFPQG